MEIHVPEGPTHSLREFAIHIAIVTVGILIALGLDNIREVIHDHGVVTEARDNFRTEIEGDRTNIALELENTRAMQTQIAGIVQDLPTLRQHPDQIGQRVAAIQPSFYFFTSARWQAALSTGALGHMKPDEVSLYADVNFLVGSYMSLEAEALPAHQSLEAYFAARPTLAEQDLAPGIEKLLIFQKYVETLKNVGGQLKDATDRALKRP